jgi:hypothetical protein
MNSDLSGEGGFDQLTPPFQEEFYLYKLLGMQKKYHLDQGHTTLCWLLSPIMMKLHFNAVWHQGFEL